MPLIQYKEVSFRKKSLDLIELVNSVIAEYMAMGYELTLRQAYYQLVARGYIPNSERSYKNIGNLINEGRLAGPYRLAQHHRQNKERQGQQPLVRSGGDHTFRRPSVHGR